MHDPMGFAGDVAALAGSRDEAVAAARRLGMSMVEIELETTMRPRDAELLARTAISMEGQVVDLGSAGSAVVQVCGLVRTGASAPHPALVTVTIQPGPAGAHLAVRGAAKEGRLRRRNGEKAARRIADRLRAAAGA